MIIGVHLTGISKDDARRLLKAADIVTSCASRHIREEQYPWAGRNRGASLRPDPLGKGAAGGEGKGCLFAAADNTMPLPVLPEKKQPRPLV